MFALRFGASNRIRCTSKQGVCPGSVGTRQKKLVVFRFYLLFVIILACIFEIRKNQTAFLSPSIGNWNFECKSHYWITKNKVRFARHRSDWEIKAGRKEDGENKAKYFKKKN